MIMKKLVSIIDNAKYAFGILSGRKAFKGPRWLSVYLTNACNLNCLGCVYHSARNPNRFSDEWKRESITDEQFYFLVNQARRLGVRGMILSGNGEPLLHSRLMQYIELVKRNGMICQLITNGTLINPAVLKNFAEAGLDELVISLWDNNPVRYEEHHPGHGDTLEIIKEYLAYYKQHSMKLPRIQLLFMIDSRNYNRLGEMYDFAVSYNIPKVSFKMFRPYLNVTPEYFLNREQLAEVVCQLKIIGRQKKMRGTLTNSVRLAAVLERSIPENYRYNNEIFKTLPCYIGWLYALILVNGNVAPCCGCQKKSLGNIYTQSLEEIWNSAGYEEFRAQALGNKDDSAFAACHCGDTCPHYQENFKVHRWLRYLR
jgi:MoaA/NifB/PqqE/SkfB family radical SAM enzyme